MILGRPGESAAPARGAAARLFLSGERHARAALEGWMGEKAGHSVWRSRSRGPQCQPCCPLGGRQRRRLGEARARRPEAQGSGARGAPCGWWSGGLPAGGERRVLGPAAAEGGVTRRWRSGWHSSTGAGGAAEQGDRKVGLSPGAWGGTPCTPRARRSCVAWWPLRNPLSPPPPTQGPGFLPPYT